MKLSDRFAATAVCPEGKVEVVHWDEELPGFGLRVRASGTHSWLCQYAVHGKTRRMTFGNPPTVSAYVARQAAKTAMASVRIGGDPAKEKATTREQAAVTVGSLIPAFLEHAAKLLAAKTHAESTRHLTRYAKPLHGLPVATVELRAIAELLDSITRERGPVASNKVRAALSSFFGWVASKGHRDTNPVSRSEKAIENGPRERALSNTELAAVYNGAAAVGGDYGDVVRLLALTGLRRAEIGELRWSEIDFDAAQIALPKERTKTGKEHLVPLSPQAIAILKARPRLDGRDLVFGGFSAAGFASFNYGKRGLDKLLNGAVAPWTLHDLRRTMSTALNEAPFSVGWLVVEALLGHTIKGVAGVYNKAIYLPERRAALIAWGQHVERIAAGATVTELPRKAA